jgi:hypothetical protein
VITTASIEAAADAAWAPPAAARRLPEAATAAAPVPRLVRKPRRVSGHPGVDER